jgi:hypothetical protein
MINLINILYYIYGEFTSDMVILIATYLKPKLKLSLRDEYNRCFQKLKKEMIDVVDNFIEVRPNITYTLQNEKLKIEVKGTNNTEENEYILIRRFIDCINTINVYEMFNNNIHLLNMILEGRPDLTDGFNVDGGTLYMLKNIYALYESIYDI